MKTLNDYLKQIEESMVTPGCTCDGCDLIRRASYAAAVSMAVAVIEMVDTVDAGEDAVTAMWLRFEKDVQDHQRHITEESVKNLIGMITGRVETATTH